MQYRFLFILFFLISPFYELKNSEIKKFTLITTLYNEKDSDRVDEFIMCLEKNLTHELIDQIFIFYDTSKDNAENKLYNYLITKPVTIKHIKGRPSFRSCFKVANKLYPKSRIIVANADIYFNETLHALDDYNLTHKFLAITRWDVLSDGNLKLFTFDDGVPACGSQDAWIFKTPISFKKSRFKLGILGCDNAIAYWAIKSGYRTINPCLTIQCCHLHWSGIRNYEGVSPYPGDEFVGVQGSALN